MVYSATKTDIELIQQGISTSFQGVRSVTDAASETSFRHFLAKIYAMTLTVKELGPCGGGGTWPELPSESAQCPSLV